MASRTVSTSQQAAVCSTRRTWLASADRQLVQSEASWLLWSLIRFSACPRAQHRVSYSHSALPVSRLVVSGAPRPWAYRLGGELAADLVQFHGTSSSVRAFGQPWTRRVSRSVK